MRGDFENSFRGTECNRPSLLRASKISAKKLENIYFPSFDAEPTERFKGGPLINKRYVEGKVKTRVVFLEIVSCNLQHK